MAEQFTIEPERAGRRLDQAVHERLPGFSRARIQEWIKGGRVRVNGAAARASYGVRAGDRVEVEPAAPPPLRALAEDIPLRVLYEDDDLVAIDKPAGLVVHAGAGVQSGTLVNALLHRFASLSGTGGPLRPGIVHRLDRFTSGVLLVAKHDGAHQALAAQFASRSVEKVYLALVHGEMPAEEGRIAKPIARDPARRVRMTSRLGRGREAWSQYRVARRFDKFSLLEVRIGTGRTHQIRVHLSSLGHPVVGDRLYGAPAAIPGKPPLARYWLHAYRIRLRQPTTGAELAIAAPLAAELREWVGNGFGIWDLGYAE